MDVFLAFPLLVFAIALAGVIPDQAFGLEGNALRIVLLIFIIGFFNWPYIGRIVRGQTLSLREREFVDAARSLGARRPYILFTRAAAQPDRADPRLLDAADPDQHPVRGGAVVPRRRRPAADRDLGRHALRRGELLHGRRTSCSGPAWRSSSPSWPSTCSATGCATRSTPGLADRSTHEDEHHPLLKKGRNRTMRSTRWRAVAALTAVAALGLSACGGEQRRQRATGAAVASGTAAVQRRRRQGLQPVRQEGRHAQDRPTPATGTRSTRVTPTTATPGTSPRSTAARW